LAEPASEALQLEMREAFEAKGDSYSPRTEHFDDNGDPRYFNRLIFEDSPYLLQHAHNPVNWYPWGEEAFRVAKEQNKPVFLSIGYATCHWCHVMERESFENEEIAEQLNRDYVPVKVDREQLPDVDATYMTAVQILTGSGGWPMSTFLQADAKPFHGGTYYPPAIFTELLGQVADVWQNDQPRIAEFAGQLSEAVSIGNALSGSAREVGDREIARARAELLESFDDLQGGFGPAPKFPREPALAFLLELALRDGDADALEAANFTLQRIAAGGIHDHVAGGFHRYAVDPDWLIPHFEKMLYNQAWLARSYMQAYTLTADTEHARTARRVLDYVLREMTGPQGGFYSATDADSDGGEGRFFIWTKDQLVKVLGEEDAKFAIDVWGVTDDGNFEESNILHLQGSIAEVAADFNLTAAGLSEKLDTFSAKLLPVRNTREPPLTDRKVITEWNAMMATTYIMAYEVFAEQRYLDAALNAVNFIWQHNRNSDAHLFRAHFNGQSSVDGSQADYAYLAQAMLAIFDVTGDDIWMTRTKELVNVMNAGFWDDQQGGYFIGGASAGGAALPSRPKDLFDNAVATGNSIALQVLTRLWHRTGDNQYRERAEKLLNAFASNLEQGASAYSYLLVGALEMLNGESGARHFAGRGKVKVEARATANGVEVDINTAPGWHINAAQPLQDYLIKTQLTLAGGETPASINYPSAVQRVLGFQSEELALYEGDFSITASLPDSDAPVHALELQS
jgi:uncharacterized protein YyaL (SSP411 family)